MANIQTIVAVFPAFEACDICFGLFERYNQRLEKFLVGQRAASVVCLEPVQDPEQVPTVLYGSKVKVCALTGDTPARRIHTLQKLYNVQVT